MNRLGYFAAAGGGGAGIELLGFEHNEGVTGAFITISANIPADCEFLLVSFTSRDSGGSPAWTPAGCWVGSSANLLTPVTPLFSANARPCAGFQYRINPPTGAQTIRIQLSENWFSSGSQVCAYYLKGVNQGTPVFANQELADLTNPRSVTLAANGLGFVAMAHADAMDTTTNYTPPPVELTEACFRQDGNANTTTFHGYRLQPPEAATLYGVNYSGSSSWGAVVGVSLNPG